MVKGMARKRRQGQSMLVLNSVAERRLREELMRRMCSAPAVEACFTPATERTRTGVVVSRWIFTPPRQADTPNCRVRRCRACSREVPSIYMVRHRDRRICLDCSLDPGSPVCHAYGPSPLHTALEAIRTMNVRLRW